MRPQLSRTVVVVTTWARWRGRTTENKPLLVWGMNILRVCGSAGEEKSWVFPVLILSPVKMVEETRGIKLKRTSICQSGCFRSVTLDFSVLTWLGWHDTACYCYCDMCNAFVCTSQGCWFHYNLLTCPNYVGCIMFWVPGYLFYLSSFESRVKLT